MGSAGFLFLETSKLQILVFMIMASFRGIIKQICYCGSRGA